MTHTDCSIVSGKLRNLTLSWLNNAATARNFPFYWWNTSIIPIVFPVTMTKAKNSKTVSKLLKSILPGGTSSMFRGNLDHPLSLAMYRHIHEWKLGFNWFWTKLALPTGTKVSLALTMDVVMHKNHISGASRACGVSISNAGGLGHITHCDFYNADCVVMPTAYKWTRINSLYGWEDIIHHLDLFCNVHWVSVVQIIKYRWKIRNVWLLRPATRRRWWKF